MEYWNKPMADKGLISYRYKGTYGYIMIGAVDNNDAMKEAERSTRNPIKENLEIWDGHEYIGIN